MSSRENVKDLFLRICHVSFFAHFMRQSCTFHASVLLILYIHHFSILRISGVSRDFLEGRQSDGGAVASVGQKQQKDPSLEIGNTLELGDLNDLTIANDNESTYDVRPSVEI